MSWKQLAISIYSGEKIYLQSMKGGESGLDQKPYWIVPKKLALDPQRRITQLLIKMALKFKVERKEGMTEEEIKKIVADKIACGEIEYNPFDENMQETLEIAFLHGVHEHNFDDANKKKESWDIDLFKSFLEYYPVLIEIFQEVQKYNKTFELDDKKKENSGT